MHRKIATRTICVNENYNGDVDISKEIDLEKWNGKIDKKIWEVVDNFECMYEQVSYWVEKNEKISCRGSNDSVEKYLYEWCEHVRKDYNN